MSKTARLYQDTRTANAAGSHLDKLNDELQDVTRIMTKNMEELLWRGDSLDSASSRNVTMALSSLTFFVHSRRNVSFVDFFANGVREVSQGSTQNQHRRYVTPIRSSGCSRFVHHHLSLVEVLVNEIHALWIVIGYREVAWFGLRSVLLY